MHHHTRHTKRSRPQLPPRHGVAYPRIDDYAWNDGHVSNHDASRPANPTSPETMPSVPSGDDASVSLPGVDDRIVADLDRLQSASTARNYRQDWIRFASWCAPREVSLMPTDPRAVADYVRVNAETRSEAGDRMYSIATLSRWVASINYWHRASGLPLPGRSPCVKDALAQARKAYRQNGDAQLSGRTHFVSTRSRELSIRVAGTRRHGLSERGSAAIAHCC